MLNNRIFAAHEIPPPRSSPHVQVDSHLQEQIVQKIQTHTRREDLRPWQTAINTLSMMFAQWPDWKNTIDFIMAHHFTNRHKEEKHRFATTNGLMILSLPHRKDTPFEARTTVGDMLLIQVQHCRSRWQEESNQRQRLTRRTLHTTGARAFTVGLKEAWHMHPSPKTCTSNRVSPQSFTRGNTRNWHTDHLSFMELPRAVKNNITKWPKVEWEGSTQLPSFLTSFTDMRRDGWFEVTLLLLWDSQSRWIVRSHLATTMGFSI